MKLYLVRYQVTRIRYENDEHCGEKMAHIKRGTQFKLVQI